MLYVYIGCMTFGVFYTVVSAVLGGHGADHAGIGHGSMHGHPGNDSGDIPSPFNPLVIAGAILAFGAVGFIGKIGFNMGDILSLVFALIFALLVGAGIFFGVIKLMYGSQSDSTFSQDDLVDMEAEVITPIPQKGAGEIAVVINGVRSNFPARSFHNSEIPKGTVVRIREIAGNMAVVAQKMSIDDIEFLENDENIPERKKKNENNQGGSL